MTHNTNTARFEGDDTTELGASVAELLGDETREATTEDEAADLLADLEAGDRLRTAGKGQTDEWRVVDAYMGGHDGTVPKADLKKTSSFSHGTTTVAPSGFRHFCLHTCGRGMSSHFSRVERLD